VAHNNLQNHPLQGAYMKVTVLIATRNRSEGLRRTLESLFTESSLRLDGWEVVVVFDDVAEDGTREVCQIFRSKYPDRLRYFAQRKEGKSNALNLGIAAARGEVLALTDDDVICAPDYIAGVQHVFEHYPVDAAQGRIFLDCEGGLPAYMSEELRGFMSSCDFGDRIQSPFKRNLFGTNMAVRTEAARAVGGFTPELGAGATVGFSEDTEFSIKLHGAGYRIIYAPQIVVRHQLPTHRMTPSFFRKRYLRMGRSRAYYQPYPTPLWRFGVYAAKNWIASDFRSWWLRMKGRPADALDCQCEARKCAGFFWQHVLFWRGVPRKLSRVTSWADLAAEAGEAPVPLENDEPRIRVQAAGG
jgi:cellulose synthase/poly-beta-1,6-N-acetylglucosamine synthase-like glycosyltransferase